MPIEHGMADEKIVDLINNLEERVIALEFGGEGGEGGSGGSGSTA